MKGHFMAEANEAAPQGTEANPTQNTNEQPAQTPEISAEQVAQYLGTNAETLGKFQKFVEANGKFDAAFSKIKTDISNPEPKAPAESNGQTPNTQPEQAAPQQPAQPVQPTKPVEGAITQQEFMAQQYFKALAGEEKYAPIAKGIASGEYLKEMSAFGINALNSDGSINDQKVRMYLDLKAQTVPAQPTNTEPNMSNAPTVDYITVGDKIENMEQAQAVFMQKGHPKHQAAADYIKAVLAGKDPYAKPVDNK